MVDNFLYNCIIPAYGYYNPLHLDLVQLANLTFSVPVFVSNTQKKNAMILAARRAQSNHDIHLSIRAELKNFN